jgi:opacity protein-like surface antigen
MRKLLFIAALTLFAVGPALARDCSSFEVTGSYDYVRVSTKVSVTKGTSTTSSTVTANLNGWNAEAAANATCWLGIVAQFSGVYGTPSGTSATLHVYPALFGPRINLRNSTSVTPFVESLFGVAHASVKQGGISASQNVFSTALGGGLDVKASSHMSIRLIEVDDLVTHIANRYQNNARISAGIVFRFGGS